MAEAVRVLEGVVGDEVKVQWKIDQEISSVGLNVVIRDVESMIVEVLCLLMEFWEGGQ